MVKRQVPLSAMPAFLSVGIRLVFGGVVARGHCRLFWRVEFVGSAFFCGFLWVFCNFLYFCLAGTSLCIAFCGGVRTQYIVDGDWYWFLRGSMAIGKTITRDYYQRTTS